MGKLMTGKPTKNEAKHGTKVKGQKNLGYENEKAGGMSKGKGTESEQKTPAKVKRSPEGDGGGR